MNKSFLNFDFAKLQPLIDGAAVVADLVGKAEKFVETLTEGDTLDAVQVEDHEMSGCSLSINGAHVSIDAHEAVVEVGGDEISIYRLDDDNPIFEVKKGDDAVVISVVSGRATFVLH